MLGVAFLGLLAAAAHRLAPSGHTQPTVRPVFEARLGKAESRIKEIDRSIYAAILALRIPAADVAFRAVELKRDGGEVWTFSEMEIDCPADLVNGDIKKVFLRRISESVPEESIEFASESEQGLTLDVYLDARHTHHLAFFKRRGDRGPEPSPSTLGKVAIIIDDLGYDEREASRFLALDGAISFSVLPRSPFGKSIASSIHQRGLDVLVHLPMEPEEYPEVNPGPGALLSSMTPDELLEELRTNLDSVPFAVGANNHMGSKLTRDPARMRQVFTVLKKRGLFFVDSLTSPGTYCGKAARLMKVKFAQRHIFLDHDQDPSSIRLQLKRLVAIARKYGRAIGIGHPYRATWEVLEEDLVKIKRQVELVKVSELAG